MKTQQHMNTSKRYKSMKSQHNTYDTVKAVRESRDETITERCARAEAIAWPHMKTQQTHAFNKSETLSKGASHDLCYVCGLSEQAVTHTESELEQVKAHAQRLADALKESLNYFEDMTPTARTHKITRHLRDALAQWEGSKCDAIH